jgi:hypothetical protein
MLLCSRQTGKSTVTAALACHTALYEPGSLVLCLAPSQNQSRELFRKLVNFYREAGDLDPEAESAQRLELPDGSRVVSLSGNPATVRGYSGPRLVILDEAAWIDDELFHAVTPMLAAGGRLVAMTTPFGRRGWFSCCSRCRPEASPSLRTWSTPRRLAANWRRCASRSATQDMTATGYGRTGSTMTLCWLWRSQCGVRREQPPGSDWPL